MSTKYELSDTTNGAMISNHKTLRAAVVARSKFLARVERVNGRGSYVTTEIRECKDGEWRKVGSDECGAAVNYKF